MHGVIKSYNEKKGYGFITSDLGDDVFFHISSVNGLSEFLKGRTVEFGVEQSEKGTKANSVAILGSIESIRDFSGQKNRMKFFRFKEKSVRISNIKSVELIDEDAIYICGDGQLKTMYYKTGSIKGGLRVKEAISDLGGILKDENPELITFSFDFYTLPIYRRIEFYREMLEEISWKTKPEISLFRASYIKIYTYQDERIILSDYSNDYVMESYEKLLQILG